MDKPTGTLESNGGDLKICYKKLFDTASTGGREIAEYELLWNAGNPNGPFTAVKTKAKAGAVCVILPKQDISK